MLKENYTKHNNYFKSNQAISFKVFNPRKKIEKKIDG